MLKEIFLFMVECLCDLDLFRQGERVDVLILGLLGLNVHTMTITCITLLTKIGLFL